MDYSKSKGDIKERREYNLKVFKLTTEILKGLDQKKLDPFAVMEKEMQASAAKGIRPVIIIDELQALEGIYFNGQRELLKELFNFFVAMTKESHLCHVIIASSDGYFIERIYNDSKLKKAADFMEVEYLLEEDVGSWLNDLEGQSSITAYTLTKRQKEKIWENFGGSCWEISRFLGDLIRSAENGMVNDKNFDNTLQKKLIAARSMFIDYASLSKQKRALLLKIQQTVRNGKLEEIDLESLVDEKIYDEHNLRNELTELVRQNFLAYNPVTAIFSIQGRSLEIGLNMFAEKIKKRSYHSSATKIKHAV